jgi:hypothetical protein
VYNNYESFYLSSLMGLRKDKDSSLISCKTPHKNKILSGAWWHMPETLALGRKRQEDHEKTKQNKNKVLRIL